eukprot:scaffold14148_cov172-Alexandrium_tamarense.AAC.1
MLNGGDDKGGSNSTAPEAAGGDTTNTTNNNMASSSSAAGKSPKEVDALQALLGMGGNEASLPPVVDEKKKDDVGEMGDDEAPALKSEPVEGGDDIVEPRKENGEGVAGGDPNNNGTSAVGESAAPVKQEGESAVKSEETDDEEPPSKTVEEGGNDGQSEDATEAEPMDTTGEDGATTAKSEPVEEEESNGGDKSGEAAAKSNDAEPMDTLGGDGGATKEVKSEAAQESSAEEDDPMDTSEGGEPSAAAKPDAGEANVATPKKEGDGMETNEKPVKPKEDVAAAAAESAPATNYPLLIGTLSYSEQEGVRRHQIRGNWKYEHNPDTTPQRFELLRNIPADEELKELPKDGEFHGTFSLSFTFKNAKGKVKTKRTNVAESGVNIAFTKKKGDEGTYDVKGKGVNQYGTFELIGTATKSTLEDDPTYNVKLRKIYVTTTPVAALEKKDKKRKIDLPPPTDLPKTGAICLRGKYTRNTSENLSLGLGDVVHRIKGVWALALESILADPNNTKKLCNDFEYEHRCSGESTAFPLSGKYTGWFYMNNDDGSDGKTKITEGGIQLKFIPNSAGHHNVEGKGKNFWGNFTITGTLADDGTITIFRTYQAVKLRVTKKARVETSTPAPGPLNGGSDKKPKKTEPAEPLLISFDEVKAPDGSKLVPICETPAQYSAVSRGILKVGDDGAHTCTGSWALSTDHFTSGATSQCHFGILQNPASEDAKIMLERMEACGASEIDNRNKQTPGRESFSLAETTFPIDSARYKGTFKMRQGTTKFQTIRDDQVVLKFVKNTSGSYNVYGKGVNSVGKFDLTGTLIGQGPTSGLLNLYRIYPLVAPEPDSMMQSASSGKSTGKVFPGSLTEKAAGGIKKSVPGMKSAPKFTPSQSGLQRRESSRQTKLPSRLEDGDPEAQKANLMEKCRQVLKELQAKDTTNIFAVPVDPILHHVPNYFDVIKHPMDLGTIQAKLDTLECDTPEEFIRLVRLVFQNAVTFNTMPDNFVHIAARNLLAIFNQKIRAVEDVLDNSDTTKKLSKAELKELKRQEKEAKKKKRKSGDDGGNEPKRLRVEDYVAATKSLMDSLSQVAPRAPDVPVSRTEFNLLLQMIQKQHEHTVAVHKLVSKSSSSGSAHKPSSTPASYTSYTVESAPPKKSKKKVKPREDTPPPSPIYTPPSPVDVAQPLTFDEQEALSEAINQLADNLLPGAMQIIREADFVNDDDDEVDLDIDQLDTRTQRKLLCYVMENVKPKKKKKPKKKQSTTPASAVVVTAPSPAVPSPLSEEKVSTARPSTSGKSFFSLGQDDSDSDSDGDDGKQAASAPKPAAAQNDMFADDDDEDDDEDLKVGDIATNWVAN